MLLRLVKRVSLPLSFYFNVPTYCIARDVFRYVLVASKFNEGIDIVDIIKIIYEI